MPLNTGRVGQSGASPKAGPNLRRLVCCLAPRWGATLIGLFAILVAVSAYELGLDNNPVMGPRRTLLLFFGLAILLAVHYGRISALLRGSRPRGGSRPAPEPIPRHEGLPERGRIEAPHSPRSMWPASSLILPTFFSLYLWLATAGQWTKPLPQTTFYYDMLADALASGQTFLKQAPDPRLAELTNPYDPAERAEIPRCSRPMISGCYLFDASYFHGKYYLYWGPAPAAVLAALKLGGVGEVGDATIALIGACALFTLLTLCLTQLWHRYFCQLPGWLLAPPLILAGLAYPLPWVLDAPYIYEAAILLGAAFLVAGFSLAIPVLTSNDHAPWRLALVGILWSISIGSRVVLAIPIAILVGAVAWRLVRPRSATPRPRQMWKSLLALAIPVALSTTLIGTYNFARFSNPLETGWRFQLGGGSAQAAGLQAVFKLGNIPANTYNYLFAGASFSEAFPFIEPVPATLTVGPIQIPHPGPLHGEYVTGLFITTPFVFFACYLLWWSACSAGGHPKAPGRVVPFAAPDLPALQSLAVALALASIAALLPILSVHFVTARYLLDVSPLLTVLSSLGAWTAYKSASRTTATRLFVGSAIVATVAVSGVVSVLLALNNLSR